MNVPKCPVDNIVLIGAPVAELTLNNYNKIIVLYAGYDVLSWNVSWYDDVEFEFVGWFGHTGYFNDKHIKKTLKLINKHID